MAWGGIGPYLDQRYVRQWPKASANSLKAIMKHILGARV